MHVGDTMSIQGDVQYTLGAVQYVGVLNRN